MLDGIHLLKFFLPLLEVNTFSSVKMKCGKIVMLNEKANANSVMLEEGLHLQGTKSCYVEQSAQGNVDYFEE